MLLSEIPVDLVRSHLRRKSRSIALERDIAAGKSLEKGGEAWSFLPASRCDGFYADENRKRLARASDCHKVAGAGCLDVLGKGTFGIIQFDSFHLITPEPV